MNYPQPYCLECRWFDKGKTDGYYCKAFPDGIPDAIIYGDITKHDKPLKKQGNEYVFERRK